MKKFKHVALLLLAAVVMWSCGDDYDDTQLRNDVNDLKSRVEKLEKWCDTANGQITAMQGVVTALQENDYVTGVVPAMEGTTEVGYTITFTKSDPVTIVHGKNGKDGTTPIIGVKKHTDGLYYWTIQTGSAEATWMKDAAGNMIPTTGKDGAAGQKPVIGLAKDGGRYYWQVDGKWLVDASGNKVPATGDKGDNGAAGADGDSFFKSVTPDTAKGTVVIKLADGTEFTLPMLSTTVSFEAYTPLQIAATGIETEVKVILPITLKKANFAAIKADITNVAGTNSAITRASEKWAVALTAPTFKQDGTLDAQPTVKVTIPASASVNETALLEVTVVDTKGNKSTSTRVLYLKNQVAVTGITLADATVSLGDKKTLTATIVPADATIQTVTWSSSNVAVATINATTGEVTAVAKGETTITAISTSNTTVKATCKVTVEEKPSMIWAKGNLVADGANGAKIGEPTDKGLYFQFGSLVGWSATGNPAIAVKPAAFNGKEGWADKGKIWQGTTGTVPFTVKASGSADEKAGIGDPCRYYLGDTWRLPTKDEYVALFKDGGYPSGTWKWEKSSATNSTKNLTFPASGCRYNENGFLVSAGQNGYYWSASQKNASDGYSLSFGGYSVSPSGTGDRAIGLPVRCVK